MAGEESPTALERTIICARENKWSEAKRLYPLLTGHPSTKEWVIQEGLKSQIAEERKLAVILLDNINDWPAHVVDAIETMRVTDPSESVRENAQQTLAPRRNQSAMTR